MKWMKSIYHGHKLYASSTRIVLFWTSMRHSLHEVCWNYSVKNALLVIIGPLLVVNCKDMRRQPTEMTVVGSAVSKVTVEKLWVYLLNSWISLFAKTCWLSSYCNKFSKYVCYFLCRLLSNRRVCFYQRDCNGWLRDCQMYFGNVNWT